MYTGYQIKYPPPRINQRLEFYTFKHRSSSVFKFISMKKIASLLFVSVLLITNAANAQVKCPVIKLSSPDIFKEGQPGNFTAMVSGGEPNVSYTYNWSVSSGTIISGQGTPSITVDTKDLGGQSCTATVDLGGADRSCQSYASATFSIDMVPKTAMHTSGNFNTTKLFTEDVNKFAIDFMTAGYGDESTKAVIFLYPGNNKTAAAAINQMTAIVKKSLTQLSLKPATYKIITAGNRPQTSYEMWIVPKGGEAPVATPVH